MHPALERLANGIVVSCQSYAGEPLRVPGVMALFASAAVAGGAVGVRVQGVDDIRDTAQAVDTPVIGLWKDGPDGVFITPTLRHARAVRDAGATIVALDGTRRPRPDGLTLAETIAALRSDGPTLVMADCACLEDALAAEEAGADVIGTTLAGYTDDRPRSDGPDLELVASIVARMPSTPVVAEGRIHSPDEARQALEAGAFAAVVGTAITHPTSITSWFVDATRDAGPRQGRHRS